MKRPFKISVKLPTISIIISLCIIESVFVVYTLNPILGFIVGLMQVYLFASYLTFLYAKE